MLRLLLITTAISSALKTRTVTMATATLKDLDFEVFGVVQGVFFRKYTKTEADKLGLRGWCKNTSQGTVLGHLQGPADKIESMMQWLRNVGSPSSKIDKAEFRNEKVVNEFTFDGFSIRKD